MPEPTDSTLPSAEPTGPVPGPTTTPFITGRPMAAGNEPVYKVIRLVARSRQSWEDAARRGVAEAGSTIAHLSYARVDEMDAVVDDGQVSWYRVKLELAFQIDRTRPSTVEGKPAVQVRRYLIVADRTQAGERIPELVAERAAAGPAEFHILVPATRSKETLRMIAGGGDPMSGYSVVSSEHLAAARARDHDQAEARLATFLDRLSAYRNVITSEVGRHDPFSAIGQVLERSSFDEIIVSTFPGLFSKPLRIDLVNRIRRAHGIPVVEINPPRS